MIQEITNKMDYALLLTESDPNINLVEDYLEKGQLYGYFVDNEPVSFIAVLKKSDNEVEIKNILTLQEHRGHGYAKSLIQYIEKMYQSIPTIYVSTANSSMTNIAFYTKLGYHYSHRIEEFFIKYYPQEIYENGLQAVDLLYFKKSLVGLN